MELLEKLGKGTTHADSKGTKGTKGTHTRHLWMWMGLSSIDLALLGRLKLPFVFT